MADKPPTVSAPRPDPNPHPLLIALVRALAIKAAREDHAKDLTSKAAGQVCQAAPVKT
jgi:hypothetical protein